MKKNKIEIITEVDNEKTSEKYICKEKEGYITFNDKSKSTFEITYDHQKAYIKRSGSRSYKMMHDGKSNVEATFATIVENEPFTMVMQIKNKYFKVFKCDKILCIEIHFQRDDNSLVKQIYKVG